MRKIRRYIAAICLPVLLGACMDYGPLDEEAFSRPGRGLFITCEGNFTSDNATLCFYDTAARSVDNEVFLRANGMKLGDVAQSMTIRGKKAYVVVNNSGVIYVLDTDTFRVTGLIQGVVSPRNIHFTNDTTAYVTDLYDPHITVVDTRNNRIRSRISTNNHKSTEQLVQLGDEVFVNCWSYDRKILVFDARHDRLIDSVEVGWQPTSLALDRRGKLWTLVEGDGSPALLRIDPASRRIEQTFALPGGMRPSQLTLNGARDTLYFICRDVWRMPVEAVSLPTVPFLPYAETTYFSLGVDPVNSEVYIGDAIDYVQHGAVYRFTPRGLPVDTLRVGINPGSFCFKP